jgi:hypothetical protein
MTSYECLFKLHIRVEHLKKYDVSNDSMLTNGFMNINNKYKIRQLKNLNCLLGGNNRDLNKKILLNESEQERFTGTMLMNIYTNLEHIIGHKPTLYLKNGLVIDIINIVMNNSKPNNSMSHVILQPYFNDALMSFK